MKKTGKAASLLMFLLLLIGCGSRKAAPDEPQPPPVPIDENLLNLLPYETDVVMWVDFDKLKKSSLWSLIEEVFHNEALNIPGEDAINPLFACHEAVLGFWESEQYGSQLLIVAKGEETNQAGTVATLLKQEKSTPTEAEGFKGVKAKDFYLLTLTEKTIAFGNEAMVRMSAKAANKAGRPLTENPKYSDFEISGNASAKLRYHSDRIEPLAKSLKNVTPKINPNSVSTLNGEFFTDTGLDIDIRIQAETQMDASVIAGDLNRTKGELSKNMVVLFLGLEWLLRRIDIIAEKEVVKVDVTLDDRDVTELGHLMDRLQKIRELLENQSSNEKGK